MENLDDVVARIRDRITDFLEPEACWLWTGARTVAGPRMQKMRRRSDNTPFFQHVVTRSFGLVRVDAKRVPVHKVIYEWANQSNRDKPTNYRLYNECRNTLCCNPEHWRVHDSDAEQAKKIAEANANQDPMALVKQDCAELLEALLAVNQPRNFADVQDHPYMVDFQPAVIKEVLCAIGKSHLCD